MTRATCRSLSERAKPYRWLTFITALFFSAVGLTSGAQAASDAPKCMKLGAVIICQGTLDAKLIPAHQDALTLAISAAESIAPAAIPRLPEVLCQSDMPGLSAEWVLAKIEEHNSLSKSDKKPPLNTPLTFMKLRVFGPLNLHDGLQRPLIFENTVFCGDVTFGGTFHSRVTLLNSIIATQNAPGAFEAPNAVFQKGLELKQIIVGSIDLSEAEVAGELELFQARFGHLGLERAKLDNLLMPYAAQLSALHTSFADGWRARGEKYMPPAIVKLASAHVSGILYADKVRIEGGISGLRLRTETLRIQGAAIARADFRKINADEVILKGTKLGHKGGDPLPSCGEASVLIDEPNILSFEEARITGDFSLRTRVKNTG